MTEEDATDTEPQAIWFLDVDGVLNALAYAPAGRFREDVLNGFVIRWDPSVIDGINEVHESGLVKIVWLTTWGSDANKFISPALGLPEFEVAAEPDDSAIETFGSDWWKFRVAQEWYREYIHKRFVWTDDDLRIEREATMWARTKNFFIVHPEPFKGLLLTDLDHIWSFVKGPSQG